MRAAVVLLLAATHTGCVVTVPLRTADAGRERVPTSRTYATAFVERFESLERPTAPERVTNLRVVGAVGWPDRRGPVRYVVTPARVD